VLEPEVIADSAESAWEFASREFPDPSDWNIKLENLVIEVFSRNSVFLPGGRTDTAKKSPSMHYSKHLCVFAAAKTSPLRGRRRSETEESAETNRNRSNQPMLILTPSHRFVKTIPDEYGA